MNTERWTAEQIHADFPTAQNLGQIIQEFTKRIEGKAGQVLCEVRVNDILLSEIEEDKFHSTPLEQIQTIDFKFSGPEQLLSDSLNSCREFIPKLNEAFERAADLFRREDMEKAHAFYRSCIGGADWFVQLLTHYKVVHESLYGSVSSNWMNLEVRLIESLNTVLVAYEKKDFILLADLLEYEVITILQDWGIQLDQTGVSHQSTDQQAQSPVR